GYPVVRCRWIERDASVLGRPFYLMDFAEGLIPPDKPLYHIAGWVVEADEDARRLMWTSTLDTVARLADVDWRARGLSRYEWPDRNRSCIAQNLDHWERIYDWGATFLPPEKVPVVEELRKWLRANMPGEDRVSFVWGDARFAN